MPFIQTAKILARIYPMNNNAIDACPDFIRVVNPVIAGSIFQRFHRSDQKK